MKKELAEKLIKVMGEIPTLPKNSATNHYRYCDLDTIFTVIKPIMLKNNLCFMQKVTTQSSGAELITGIETVIFDNDGNSESSFTPLPKTKLPTGNEAQNMGASITYVKRYALSAMLGISSDEDTDGVPPIDPRSDREKLQDVLKKYGASLEKNGGKKAIEDALAGTDGEVSATLERTLGWMRNAGLIN